MSLNIKSKAFDKQKVHELTMSIFNDFKEKVNINDITKISEKISSMNKGPLKTVWEKVGVLWEGIKDKEVSIAQKTVPIGALMYVITPIDAIPDVVPMLGLSDDATVVVTAASMFAAMVYKVASDSSSQKNGDSLIETSGESTQEEKIERVKVFISLLSHAAYSDNELSEDEDKKCKEIINDYIFSEEGILPESMLESIDVQRDIIEDTIAKTFIKPLNTNEIFNFINDNNEFVDLWYFYAFSITNSDNQINEQEREFLDYFSEQVGLSKFDKNKIERSYNNDWFTNKN
ncbi:YkvA family protein [Carboxylicivirga taeanensis]|uniref:YkvA family protein n=1 Tax=Carboxylicivirga taeanensis TaxID=1416875 RepID=UPI003F6DEDAE